MKNDVSDTSAPWTFTGKVIDEVPHAGDLIVHWQAFGGPPKEAKYGDGYWVPALVLNSLDDQEYKAPYSLLPAYETPSPDSITLEPDSLNNLNATWHFYPNRIVWLTAIVGHIRAIHGRVTEEFLQEVLSKVEFAE